MPQRPGRESGITFSDVLHAAQEYEVEYAVRIRFSCIPLAKPSGKSTHAITVTVYRLDGRKDHEVPMEQCLFPGGTARTREGCEMYLLTRLGSSLDERERRKALESVPFEEGALTPLEAYIMGRS